MLPITDVIGRATMRGVGCRGRPWNVRTGEDIGAGWIDTTNESIERAEARLAELNDLLTEAGSATVARPGDL